MVSGSASENRKFWDRRAEAWDRRADSLDLFSDAYGGAAMDALGVEGGDHVLDVGCGPGTTAIQLGRRVGPDGTVLGVDISAAMVAAAARRAATEGATNVRFAVADAQTDSMSEGLDAAYSRFGVMFFSDPVAAFANIGRSLRPGGRLGCVVWGPLADNPWMFVPTLAAGPVLHAELTIPGENEPGPFSLADPTRIMAVVTEAGFADVSVDHVAGSRLITASTAEDDARTLLAVGPLGEAYDNADDTARQAAVEAVVAAIEPFRCDDGWLLPGAALRIAARRP